MGQAVRRALIVLDYTVLEAVLQLDVLGVSIISVIPPDARTYNARHCELIIEGAVCPTLFEGEPYQQMCLLWVDEEKDGRYTPKLTNG